MSRIFKLVSLAVTLVLLLSLGVTGVAAGGVTTTMTLEAYEDPSGSCPWVFVWDGSEYIADNDVYSTARAAEKEFTDYYTLREPMLPKDGDYSLELMEVTAETSYTDLVQLMAIDHASNVNIASDENGDIWTYSSPSQPISAADNDGVDVISQIASADSDGFKGYNDDYISLDFGDLEVTDSAVLVLRIISFKDDGEMGDPTGVRPYIFVQTQNGGGDWVTRHSFSPHNNWAIIACNLAEYLTSNNMVRLYVTSCHTGVYQFIDYVGLDTSAQSPVTIHTLSPTSAVHSSTGGVPDKISVTEIQTLVSGAVEYSISGDILDKISTSDDDYASMTPGEKMTLIFPVPDMSGEVRDFVLVAEGYYIPSGTYYIYTWDGSDWLERGSWTIGTTGDQSQDFDLSPFLPDPDVEYKVMIFQDYEYSEAGIDYVRLTVDGTPLYITRAYNYQKGKSVLSKLRTSDNNRDDFIFWTNNFDRWVEVEWSDTPPPSVGGEVFPINKAGILAPWLTLAILLALGGAFVLTRRQHAR